MSQDPYHIADLLHLMRRLRDPQTGCPWDLKQDFASIVPHTLEEAYEVAEAIESGDYDHLAEELGDLLFQVIFYCQLAAEQQRFDFAQVVDTLVAKLVRRHPHVFPQGTLDSARDPAQPPETAAIKANWEAEKASEREAKGQRGQLADVPQALPALSRAQKLQKRASQVGFDWDQVDGVIAHLESELNELRQAVANGDTDGAREELGDLLFCGVNVARHLQTDAEKTLRAANRKFERRFSAVEAALAAAGKSLHEASLAEMDAHWHAAKRREREPSAD